MEPKDRIIVALDVDRMGAAMELIEMLAPHVGMFKVGLQLLTAKGAPTVVSLVHERGGQVFFDGKFNDIPNTVGAASAAAVSLGVKMFNVHASCGVDAMRAAVENRGDAIALAVTVLTSIGEEEAELVFGAGSRAKVLQFARDARLAGMGGVICSPKELNSFQRRELNELLKVTPGIRPAWAVVGDQKRITTPADAIRAGADYLVIGRPITKPPSEIGSPADAAKCIAEEIATAV